MFKSMKNWLAWRKINKEDVYSVSESTMDSYEDAGSISADMALKLVQGDPKAIKKYRQLQAKGVKHIE